MKHSSIPRSRMMGILWLLVGGLLMGLNPIPGPPLAARSPSVLAPPVWSAWTSLGKPSAATLMSIAVGQEHDGRLEVFAWGITNVRIYRSSQAVPSGTAWTNWEQLGNPAVALGYPAVGPDQDGRLEVFAEGESPGSTAISIWHSYQTTPNYGWSDWVNLGLPSGVNLGMPVVGRNQDGRLEV